MSETFTSSCWISYVLDRKIRGRQPSSWNQLLVNDALVIDLYDWLTHTHPRFQRRLMRFTSVNNSSYNQQIRNSIPDFSILTYFFLKCVKCFDNKKCWSSFITHFEFFFFSNCVSLVLSLTRFIFFLKAYFSQSALPHTLFKIHYKSQNLCAIIL